MNREIKFRAWNGKEMHFVDQITFTERCHGHADQIGYSVNIKFQPNVYLMQYTGLKDDDGKEIYEGDVLSFIEVDEESCMGAEEKHIGVIKWIDNCAQFRFEYASGRRSELYLIIGFQQTYDIKVIGNIYENKDLLT